MFSEQIESVKDQLRPYIVDLLRAHNKPTNKLFHCVNPDHLDKKPSMGYWDEGQVVHCFSCSAVYDIFSLFHILEGAPKDGAGFIYDNVRALAKRYGIPWEDCEVTQEYLRKSQIARAYEAASQVLISEKIWSNEHTSKRLWEDDVCKKHFVGTVGDYQGFITQVSFITGMSEAELSKIAIGANTFGPNKITYTIFDANGGVMGFQARNMGFESGETDIKCYTTPNEFEHRDDVGNVFRERNPLVTGKTRLYGLHIAKQHATEVLDVYEGPGSWIMSQQNGHNCCISLLGTVFNNRTLTLLSEFGFRSINLVMDDDPTGLHKTEEYLEKIDPPSGHRITATFLQFRDEHRSLSDAEDYIREYSIESYRSLPAEDLFDFKIRKLLKTEQNITIEQGCDLIIPLIINTENSIRRGQMIHKLASAIYKMFSDDLNDAASLEEDIRSEVERRIAANTTEVRGRIVARIHSASGVDDIHSILTEEISKIDEGGTKNLRDRVSAFTSVNRLKDLYDEINTTRNSENKIPGWVIGYENTDNLLVSIPKKECVGLFTGDPHHGKSAFVQNMMIKMLRNTNNKNMSILYWSIDDGFTLTTSRILAAMSGLHRHVVSGIKPASQEQEKILQDTKEELYWLMDAGRLVIKDTAEINHIRIAERWIQEMQQTHGNEVLMIVDALNDVPIRAQNDYDRQDRTVDWLLQMTSNRSCTVLGTAHTNKERQSRFGGEPSTHNMKGNNRLEFAGTIIAIIFNELQEKGNNTNHAWYKPVDTGTVRMPAIKVNVKKNKTLLGNTGVCWFKLDKDNMQFIESKEEAVALDKQEEETVETPGISTRNMRGAVKNETAKRATEPIDMLDL